MPPEFLSTMTPEEEAAWVEAMKRGISATDLPIKEVDTAAIYNRSRQAIDYSELGKRGGAKGGRTTQERGRVRRLELSKNPHGTAERFAGGCRCYRCRPMRDEALKKGLLKGTHSGSNS